MPPPQAVLGLAGPMLLLYSCLCPRPPPPPGPRFCWVLLESIRLCCSGVPVVDT